MSAPASGAAAAAPEPPPAVAPSAPAATSPGQAAGTAKARALWRGVVRWVRTDVRTALTYAAAGFVVSWLTNVVLVAAVYNGLAKAPPGSGAATASTIPTALVFWSLGMALLFGVIAYARAVGSKRFWADVRGFPSALRSLVTADGKDARLHLLWAFAGAMLVGAVLAGSVNAVLGLGSLAVLASVLRPITVGVLSSAWRRVVGSFSPRRATPPSETALVVAVLGIAAALLVAYLVPAPEARVLLAVVAGVVAFRLGRGSAPAATTTAMVIGILATAALALDVPAVLGHDGGWQECGNTFDAWLRCSGSGSVMGTSLIAGLFGSGGSLLGGGLGDGLGKDQVRSGWQASFEGGYDGLTDQLQFLGNRDVVNPLNILAALGGAPDEVLLTDDARALREWQNSGQARGLFEEFAADPLDFANKHGIGDWLVEFPNKDHSPISRDDMARYGALYDEYKQARASGDDYNANRLRGMLVATTAWIGGQVVSPEMVVEGAAARLGTRTAVGGVERIAVNELSALERTALSHIPTDVPLTAAQRSMLERGLVRIEQIEKGGVNESVRIVFEDGHAAILKPDAGGKNTIYESLLAGSKSQREVGTYLTDQHLGFNQVPTTSVMDHPELGRSSVQAWEESQAFNKTAGAFSEVDQQKAAVLDYITGNHDRHMGNVLQGTDNRLIAIDHGETFPTGESGSLLRSDMISAQANKPLDPSVVAAVKNVDPAALRQDLLANGLTPSQVDGAIARLNEVASQGQITGSGLNQQWIIINPGNPPVHLGAAPK